MANTEQNLITVSGVITKVRLDKRGNPGILIDSEDQWYNKGYDYKGKPPEFGDNVVMEVQPGGTGGFFYQKIEFDGEPNNDAVTVTSSPSSSNGAAIIQRTPSNAYINGNGKDKQEAINRSVAIKVAQGLIGSFSLPTAEGVWDDPKEEKILEHLRQTRNIMLRHLFDTADTIKEWLERPVLEDDEDDVLRIKVTDDTDGAKVDSVVASSSDSVAFF